MPGELPTSSPGAWPMCSTCAAPTSSPTPPVPPALPPWKRPLEMLTEHTGRRGDRRRRGPQHGRASFVKFCKIGALSATGSRPFGDGADGFVMGEGAGAPSCSSASPTPNATATKSTPSSAAWAAAATARARASPRPTPGAAAGHARAWEIAGLDPATATLVEAHGTSTRVGDVVEVESLAKVSAARRGTASAWARPRATSAT
jgi:hypothetical protein